MFWFFKHKACGILAPQPGIEPSLPALEGDFLTTGPPGIYLLLSTTAWFILFELTNARKLHCFVLKAKHWKLQIITYQINVPI